jgi:hypothetical protein
MKMNTAFYPPFSPFANRSSALPIPYTIISIKAVLPPLVQKQVLIPIKAVLP